MKVKMEFDLPKEARTFEYYHRAPDLKCALNEFSNHLRSSTKHCDLSEEKYAFVTEMKDKFYEILNNNGIDLMNFG